MNCILKNNESWQTHDPVSLRVIMLLGMSYYKYTKDIGCCAIITNSNNELQPISNMPFNFDDLIYLLCKIKYKIIVNN